jgi:peptidoglycan-associated lipoprotein
MRRRSSELGVGSLLLSLVMLAGCAARPDLSRASAPGPSGRATGAADAHGSALVQAAARGKDAEGSVAAVTRPAPRDYSAVMELPDIHFDFDRYDIRADAARILEKSAQWLKANPSYLVLVEGHADERGTNEYNLALGDRRAKAAVNYLVSHGVHAARFTTVSYGEERGLCRESNEACWSRNRRAHFAVKMR